MRVAVVGGGGAGYAPVGNLAIAGGGGGCAASKLVPVGSVDIDVGAAGMLGVNQGTGGTSSAQFGTYMLLATGGRGGEADNSTSAPGGMGAGGDYNYAGGTGMRASGSSSFTTGAGAAGPNGPGADGLLLISSSGNSSGSSPPPGTGGWGVPGGGCGALRSASGAGSGSGGGGGSGAAGGEAIAGPNSLVTNGLNSFPVFGEKGEQGHSITNYSSTAGKGGAMGGGGAATRRSDGASYASAAGGVGGIVVEWFY